MFDVLPLPNLLSIHWIWVTLDEDGVVDLELKIKLTIIYILNLFGHKLKILIARDNPKHNQPGRTNATRVELKTKISKTPLGVQCLFPFPLS